VYYGQGGEGGMGGALHRRGLDVKAFAVEDPEEYTIEMCEYVTHFGL
jgi:hypothetical protein